MLPTIQKLNKWKNAQIFRVESIQLYFSLHDDCPTCRGLIAFEVDGHARVVCDISEKRGGLTHTTAHRKHLQPDPAKWVSPKELAATWLDQTGITGTPSPRCRGAACSLPSINFYADSTSAKVVLIGPLQLFFSYENSGHWPSLVAFQADGDPVVCDTSEWPSSGFAVRTKKNRASLEPDSKRWLTPVEFHRRWLECSKALRS